MKKFFAEFKKFITRGNVIDLAVGMIIGAAFTAIVNAVVNGIFKPLINAIPMGNIQGLITMLVPKNTDGVKVPFGSAEIDLAKSVYINWGDVIMAIITFLITAFVLFLIVKAINSVRDKSKNIAEKQKEKIRKKLEKGKITAEEAAKEEEAIQQAPAAHVETTDDLLREIRDLLKANNSQNADISVQSENKE